MSSVSMLGIGLMWDAEMKKKFKQVTKRWSKTVR